jgi:hypothetical protein
VCQSAARPHHVLCYNIVIQLQLEATAAAACAGQPIQLPRHSCTEGSRQDTPSTLTPSPWMPQSLDSCLMTQDLRDKLGSLPADIPEGSAEARYKRKFEASFCYRILCSSRTCVSTSQRTQIAAHCHTTEWQVQQTGQQHSGWTGPTWESYHMVSAFLERLNICHEQPHVVNPLSNHYMQHSIA